MEAWRGPFGRRVEGNDFYDAFRLATLNPEVGAFVDGDVLDRARALEAQAPLATIGQTLFEPTVGERRELGPVRRFLSGARWRPLTTATAGARS